MQTVTTIGLDIAKSVFQVHGTDATGQVLIRRQLKRRHVLSFFEKLPPCLVGRATSGSRLSVASATIPRRCSTPLRPTGATIPNSASALSGRGRIWLAMSAPGDTGDMSFGLSDFRY